jgi:hypothetical protein
MESLWRHERRFVEQPALYVDVSSLALGVGYLEVKSGGVVVLLCRDAKGHRVRGGSVRG